MPDDVLDNVPSPGSSLEDALDKKENSSSQSSKNKSDSQSQYEEKVVTSKKNLSPKDKTSGEKEFDKERVKIFLIKLAKAAKRHQARFKARDDLLRHTEKIKSHVAKSKRPHVDKHITELKEKVKNVVDAEKRYPEKYREKHMQARINELEKKLSILMQSKVAKEQRFTKLEQKINRKLDADKAIVHELEQKLLVLHSKIKAQSKKKSSSKNKKDLDALKERMLMTQSAIQKLKTSN